MTDNERLIELRKLRNNLITLGISDEVNNLENIFPELKMDSIDEDENTKNELFKHLKEGAEGYEPAGSSEDYAKWLDWLEKQGEGKLTDKPKFKVGDWITFYGGKPFKILKVEPEQNGILDYLLLSQDGRDSYYNKNYVDTNARLWTIQDAKAGDVIYLPNGNNEYYFFIFKGIENATVMSFAHFYKYNNGTSEVEGTIDNLSSVNDVFQPATKEQRDLLFEKMKESGYEWDSEKKELKEVEDESYIMGKTGSYTTSTK